MQNHRVAGCALALGAALVVSGGAALAQKAAPQKASLSFNDSEVRLSAFSGSNVKVGTLWTVDTECKSPQPEIRIVRQPKNGEATFQEVRGSAELPKNHARAFCIGKPVNGVAVYYQSRDDFTGSDQMKIEVDYKLGVVRSYTVYVNVR